MLNFVKKFEILQALEVPFLNPVTSGGGNLAPGPSLPIFRALPKKSPQKNLPHWEFFLRTSMAVNVIFTFSGKNGGYLKLKT